MVWFRPGGLTIPDGMVTTFPVPHTGHGGKPGLGGIAGDTEGVAAAAAVNRNRVE